jgi:tetratricopeptide (TPR) repeat protein
VRRTVPRGRDRGGGSSVSDRQPPRTLLELLVRQREATYEEQVQAFERCARELQEPATLTVRHLQRLAAGQRSGERANPSTRRVMRELYGHPLDVLLGPADEAGTTEVVPVVQPVDPRQLSAAAARDSLDFAAWADADLVAPAVMEHVSYELGRIAVDYVSTPALPLLHDLIGLRDTTVKLLRDRPHPRQSRELFFLTGTCCLLLAHASQNLGDPASAMAQARAAFTCAEQADHHGLRAWVRGTQALIAEGSRRPAEAVKFARAGQDYAVTADSRVRLAALEARASARIGDTASVTAALARAAQARDAESAGEDELAQFGGLLTFPAAKQLYYAGGAHSLLGNHEQAKRAALTAIELYETGPLEDRSYGDEALARVDVADAQLAAGDLDGATEALTPVLSLPPAQRIRQLHDRLTRVGTALVVPRYAQSREGRSLAGELTAFAELAPPKPPVISGP